MWSHGRFFVEYGYCFFTGLIPASASVALRVDACQLLFRRISSLAFRDLTSSPPLFRLRR